MNGNGPDPTSDVSMKAESDVDNSIHTDMKQPGTQPEAVPIVDEAAEFWAALQNKSAENGAPEVSHFGALTTICSFDQGYLSHDWFLSLTANFYTVARISGVGASPPSVMQEKSIRISPSCALERASIKISARSPGSADGILSFCRARQLLLQRRRTRLERESQ